jgi:hypothetical protein
MRYSDTWCIRFRAIHWRLREAELPGTYANAGERSRARGTLVEVGDRWAAVTFARIVNDDGDIVVSRHGLGFSRARVITTIVLL